ncbi:MAG: TerC family protein [Planctomycetes bacterium]|jgi:predicted tellurium resistance membrane protein TerC|nr:TerC family protein [Planctomycetota bacterium]MBT6542097.1 TerC family protein [Planctomycetota bacterium]MBT6783849.1 TerC family protein [Planctomycetota bacterium]MBT7103785.1 TerC family protein [Planctomycetota bacterium]MBT7131151.1 TerC family protein [Planctomycetota bacterium]
MLDIQWIHDPNAWIALGTLTLMEIVLGIDNIIFIAVLAGKLPEKKRDSARKLGLLIAMGTRILLLFSISWLLKLVGPLFTIFDHSISGKDLILIGGGLFLLWKSTREIHDKIEGNEQKEKGPVAQVSFMSVLLQIAILDVVFSLDSVITAVGMAESLTVMVIAVVLSVIVMLIFSGFVSRFVEKHPTVKVLALSFLMLIGFALVAEGWHLDIPKGYIYFAMGFSAFVEVLNLQIFKRGRKSN